MYPVSQGTESLCYLILGQRVHLDCQDAEFRKILAANFGAMAVAPGAALPDLEYIVSADGRRAAYSVGRRGGAVLTGDDPGDLLYLLEKCLTVELQRRRADLLFLHSAVVDWRGKACLLVGESGAGKSTTTWAMLHHEFGYLSDELGPIDLDSMRVNPYPHALCVKKLPPPAYPLPEGAVHLGRTIHVPVHSLPGGAISDARPLGAVLFLKYCPELAAPVTQAIGPAEASARLYVQALNPLAHPNHGLDGVVRIARHVPCFAVSSAGLSATCGLIRATLESAQSR